MFASSMPTLRDTHFSLQIFDENSSILAVVVETELVFDSSFRPEGTLSWVRLVRYRTPGTGQASGRGPQPHQPRSRSTDAPNMNVRTRSTVSMVTRPPIRATHELPSFYGVPPKVDSAHADRLRIAIRSTTAQASCHSSSFPCDERLTASTSYKMPQPTRSTTISPTARVGVAWTNHYLQRLAFWI